MTKKEYLALAMEKYEELKALENSKDFYEHEKNFDKIWQDLGREVLSKTISEVGQDRRKKKDKNEIRTNRS